MENKTSAAFVRVQIADFHVEVRKTIALVKIEVNLRARLHGDEVAGL